MATRIYRASVRGARRKGYSLSRAGRVIQRTLLDTMGYRLGPTATRIFRSYAPHRSGALERGLQANVRSYGGRIGFDVISTVVSEDGFPYTDVTRFGHRVAFIYPKPPNRALRFFTASRVVFARRVRGYKPARDWVEPAVGAVDAEVSRLEGEIGRQIVSRIL